MNGQVFTEEATRSDWREWNRATRVDGNDDPL